MTKQRASVVVVVLVDGDDDGSERMCYSARTVTRSLTGSTASPPKTVMRYTPSGSWPSSAACQPWSFGQWLSRPLFSAFDVDGDRDELLNRVIVRLRLHDEWLGGGIEVVNVEREVDHRHNPAVPLPV